MAVDAGNIEQVVARVVGSAVPIPASVNLAVAVSGDVVTVTATAFLETDFTASANFSVGQLSNLTLSNVVTQVRNAVQNLLNTLAQAAVVQYF